MQKSTLRQVFSLALDCAGLSAEQFARERCEVSVRFLHMWLNGERNSRHVEVQVAAFIGEQLPAMRHVIDVAEHRYAKAA